MASQAVLKAVQSARFTQTRLLVQLGSEVNGRDPESRTPLMHALLLQEPRVRTSFLRLLLRAGAAVSQTDSKKRNALMWACRLSGSEDVRLLLRHSDEDLDLNARNVLGQTALWIAVDGGKLDTVRELLQALSKQDVNSEVADHTGVTPAMRAAALGHLDCLRALIAHLNTVTKSSNALMNLAKINHILTSMSVMNKRKTVSLIPRTPNPQPKAPPAPKVPTIQIISSDDCPPAAPVDCEQQAQTEQQGSSYALFSLQFHRDPTRCSTPVSFTESVHSISPEPQGSRPESPISCDSEDPDPNSSRPDGSGIERSVTPNKRRTRVKKTSGVKSEDQPGGVKEHKRSGGSRSPTPVKKTSTAKTVDQADILKEHKRSLESKSPTPMRKKSSTVKSENEEHTSNERKSSAPTSQVPVKKKSSTVVSEPDQEHTSKERKNDNLENTLNQHKSSESNFQTPVKKASATVQSDDQGHTLNEHKCFAVVASAPLKMTSTAVKFENQQPATNERQNSVLSSSSTTPIKKTSSIAKPEDQTRSPNERERSCVSVPSAPWKKTSTTVRFEYQQPTMSERQNSVVSSSPTTPMKKTSSSAKPEDQTRSLKERERSFVSITSAPWKQTFQVKLHGQGRVPNAHNDHRLSVSTRPFTVPAGQSTVCGPRVRRPGRIVLRPLASVTMVRGSIRGSLPELFNVIAHQTSASFRKAAVEPPPPKKIIIPQVSVSPVPPPKSPRLKLKGSKWSKLRGVAILGGLAKPTAKPTPGGKVSPKPPKLRQRKLTPSPAALQPCRDGASP
ncbi:hypothetical protein ACOMHN_049952 [Nucella lapillus]